MPSKIKVSHATFNEIADALARDGVKINEQGTLTLEKSMQLEHPYDMRLATIRKDCLVEAVKFLSNPNKMGEQDITTLAAQMFQFVLTGDKEVTSE